MLGRALHVGNAREERGSRVEPARVERPRSRTLRGALRERASLGGEPPDGLGGGAMPSARFERRGLDLAGHERRPLRRPLHPAAPRAPIAHNLVIGVLKQPEQPQRLHLQRGAGMLTPRGRRL